MPHFIFFSFLCALFIFSIIGTDYFNVKLNKYKVNLKDLDRKD